MEHSTIEAAIRKYGHVVQVGNGLCVPIADADRKVETARAEVIAEVRAMYAEYEDAPGTPNYVRDRNARVRSPLAALLERLDNVADSC